MAACEVLVAAPSGKNTGYGFVILDIDFVVEGYFETEGM